MLKATVLGLALIAAAFTARGYVDRAEAGELDDHPRIERCADHHPWTRVAERQPLIWCLAHVFDSPGTPRAAIAVAHCESGADLQDATAEANGYVGTFQQDTERWHDRWRTWGQRIGVKDDGVNVLSNVVVSVRMARSLGTWNSSAGWAGCA